jgi:hypothetical protein
MKSRKPTLTASALFRQKPIEVILPHGELELHSVGNVLSREEYYKLTQAVGLVEAGTVMSQHGLAVGNVPSNLAAPARTLAA